MYRRIFKQKGSRVYRVRYRLSDGPKIYDEPLRTNIKEVAEAKSRRLVEEKERELAGTIDAKPIRDAAHKLVLEHHSEYMASLVARGRNKDHLIHARNRLIRLFGECRWKYLRDVTADSLERWISAQTEFAAKTLNAYISHAKTFTNWLERQGRISTNPLRRIDKVPTNGKETFKRRALKVEEFLRLMDHSGNRKFPYALAVLTGLRRGELKRLLWADVHMDVEKPWIEVRASTTKNKLPATLFLVPQLVTLLERYRGTGEGLVLPKGVPGAKTLAKDLIAAGIPIQDERGWRVDFHALRHTYASLLGIAGVSEGARVKMVRHSEWRQTDNYTDPNSVPLQAGMEKLAGLLSSSQASHNSGKPSPKMETVVQSVSVCDTSAVAVSPLESPDLSMAFPERESLQMASPRGFEPRLSP